MNGCLDKGNISIDFCAVFKGVNVGGIDGQRASEVSCSEPVTHWKTWMWEQKMVTIFFYNNPNLGGLETEKAAISNTIK